MLLLIPGFPMAQFRVLFVSREPWDSWEPKCALSGVCSLLCPVTCLWIEEEQVGVEGQALTGLSQTAVRGRWLCAPSAAMEVLCAPPQQATGPSVHGT